MTKPLPVLVLTITYDPDDTGLSTSVQTGAVLRGPELRSLIARHYDCDTDLDSVVSALLTSAAVHCATVQR
jgi:hypothetical protein